MKKIIASVLILGSAPAFASTSSAPKSFTRDGVTYTYTIAQADGKAVIQGKDSLGKEFKLRVSGSRVRGSYADADVGFTHNAKLASASTGGSK